MVLPIDRTAKAALDANLVNGLTSDAPKLKASNDVVYNTIDELKSYVDSTLQGIYSDPTKFSKLGIINVKDAPFNAKGDGVSDDTAAFNAAFQAVVENGVVTIPPGTYRLNSKVICTKRITIFAYGAEFRSYEADDHSFEIEGGMLFGGLFVQMVDKTVRDKALYRHTASQHSHFYDCKFKTGNGFQKVDYLFFDDQSKNYQTFQNCEFLLAHYSIGLKVLAVVDQNDSHVTINTCSFFYLAAGAVVTSLSGGLVDNIVFDNCTFYQIQNEATIPNQNAYAENTVASNTLAGATAITLTDASAFVNGMPLIFGNSTVYEVNRISGISGNVLTLALPLKANVNAGEFVIGGGVAIAFVEKIQNANCRNCHFEKMGVGVWMRQSNFNKFDNCVWAQVGNGTVRDTSYYTTFDTCYLPSAAVAVRMKRTIDSVFFPVVKPGNSLVFRNCGIVLSVGSYSGSLVVDADSTSELWIVQGQNPGGLNDTLGTIGNEFMWYRKFVLNAGASFTDTPFAAAGDWELHTVTGIRSLFSTDFDSKPRETASTASFFAYTDTAGVICILHDSVGRKYYIKNNSAVAQTIILRGNVTAF